MKKTIILIAMIAFIYGNAFAQLLHFDFTGCPSGAKIAQTLGAPWTTWSSSPGSAEDGIFGTIGGSMSAHFTYGNDQVVQLGDYSTGVYDLEFDAYVPNGKNGYFNVLHHFAGSNSTWAIQVYLHMTNDGQNSTQAPGHGTVHAGSNSTCDLPCVYNQWMHFRIRVDTDNDIARLYFNVVGQAEILYAVWQWSLDSFGENIVDRTLGAMDFFPPENASTSEYYIDNLSVTMQSNGEVLIFDPFEEYNVSGKIAQEAINAGHEWWTTWSNAPGGSEDGLVAYYSGNKRGHFTYGNDQVLLLGDEENGNYNLEFDILVPQGKNGYFNILHHFAGSNSTWAMQCYLHMTNDGSTSTQAPGHGTVHAGSNGTADIACVYDAWMHFRLNVDTDQDIARYYYTAPGASEILVCTWQWSLDSFGENITDRVLGAMDFFPPENAATSEYYLDNLEVTLQSNDEVLLFEPFEEYTVGNKIAAEAILAGHDWWTTWSNAPGGNEDGVVSDFDTKCGHLTYGNDQVLLLGDEENGNYDLEFDILIPEGKNGYFNILHHFAGSNSTWAMQCYLHLTNDGSNSTSAPGMGTIHAGSNGTATLTNVVYDQWMHFRLNVDTDTDVANYYYTAPGEQEVLVCTWQWSLDSFGNNVVGRTLAAMNFYPPENAATSEYYLDNFSFKKIGGESAPELSIDPMEVAEELGEDDMTMVQVTIDNAGNSIGDWAGWLDFGQGGTGSQTAELFYHDGWNGAQIQGIGSSDAYSRELGIRLPATAYAGASMGMRITSVNYLVQSAYQATDHNYIFRIYGQGLHNQPGELLAEKTVNTTVSTDQWITATFDEPVYMTGQAIWATVALEQTAGEYPLSMDNGEYGEEQDGNWLSTNGNSFSHCYAAPSGGSDGFAGAWYITVNCEGELIPATWATIDKTEGAIMGGASETITLSLNSIGLDMGTSYNANLIINTNDVNMEHIEIPVTLAVTDGVEETVAQLANVYPNPATSMVTLEGENLNSVAIYNVAGQLVRVVKLDNMVNNIDMNVEAGVYFFSIYDNNGRNSVQRVVIVK